MKCTIPEISWHNRDPVLSVDIQPNNGSDSLCRLATGGSDSHVLIWWLTVEKNGTASLECATDLSRHTKPVNCVRFSPSGDLLASGDDESCIIIWKMKTSSDPTVHDFPGEEEASKEQWSVVRVLRGHLQDVYDVCWSADSKNLISGSVDNSAIMWDVTTGKNIGILSDHKGFVQGVAWDPCGQYVATMSSDRICRIFNSTSKRVVSRIYKGHLPGMDCESKSTHFFHDDTLKSFFRRLSFTPDGELLIVPSGLMEEPDKKPSNSTLIFARNCMNKPAVFLPSLNQYTVAIRCCPVYFNFREMESPPLFDLPYRIVIAVATQCSVILYDTQHAAPFAYITKIHYTRLTDLCWSSDGRVLVVSSTDGYCSVITFAENELGTVYTGERKCLIKLNEEKKTKKSSGDTKSPKVTIKCDLPVSENANMVPDKLAKQRPFKTNPTDEASTKNNSELAKDNLKSSEAKEAPMEVDDFHLTYEGTMTQTNMESILKTDSENPKISEKEQSTELLKEPSNNVSQERPETSAKLLNQASPAKTTDLSKSSQREDLTSPVSSCCNKLNATPTGNSNKKTPRRVQLITLSSPKSRKKLLE